MYVAVGDLFCLTFFMRLKYITYVGCFESFRILKINLKQY